MENKAQNRHQTFYVLSDTHVWTKLGSKDLYLSIFDGKFYFMDASITFARNLRSSSCDFWYKFNQQMAPSSKKTSHAARSHNRDLNSQGLSQRAASREVFFFGLLKKKRTDGNKNEGSNLRRVGETSTITVNLQGRGGQAVTATREGKKCRQRTKK